MAGAAASETVLFVAAIIITVAVAGVLTAVVGDMARGMGDRGGHLAAELRTHITIINDPERMETDPLVLYVKNTGSLTLATAMMNVLLDGAPSQDTSLEVLGSSEGSVLQPGEVLKITVNDLPVGPGDHRVRVVTEHGVDASLTFVVAP